MSAKETIEHILSLADITPNGDRSWDIQINNENLYKRVLSGGSLALGESYMDGWWDVKKLDKFFTKVLSAQLEKHPKIIHNPAVIKNVIAAKLFNLQNKHRAFEVGEKHYDVGNDLYQSMLDKRMTYTCGYWKDADNLDGAQEAKLDLICKKLYLEPGMTILDIGCGWGSFAKFAAENYGVSVVGITVSKEQADLGKHMCAGLPVEIRLQDYREMHEQFDRVLSIGMFEHVGYKNYDSYMEVSHRCLKDGGLSMLHTIGSLTSGTTTDPWIAKYIFPNSMLPSLKQIADAAEKYFVIEDVHNFGAYYDTTLMAWYKNFMHAWPELKQNYNDRFKRMWEYYLLACAGSFRSRKNQLWQIVLSKGGTKGVYETFR